LFFSDWDDRSWSNRKNGECLPVNETDRRLRFGSCKRSSGKLIADINNFKGHVTKFLETFREYQDWQIEHVAIATRLDDIHRCILTPHNIIPKDLVDLTEGLE